MIYIELQAWEQRKLGEVVQITMGQSPHGSNYTDNPGDYILVQGNADLKNGRVVPRIWTKQVTSVADVGHIIISVRAPVGDVGKTDYPVVLGRGVAGIRGNEFIYQTLLKMKLERYWREYSTGSTFKSINSNNLKKARIFVPEEFEQFKIGTFFQQLDNIIALHQRKLDTLKKMKNGFLQQLFPKNGEKVPRVRFTGFEGEWEQRKLGDLGSVAMNRRIFKEETSDKGEIPFYKIGTFGGRANSYIIREIFEDYKLKYPYPEKGDILISASGSIGRTVEYNGEEAYYQDSNIVWLKHDKQLDNLFLKQFYLIVKWSGIEGSAIKRLYNKNILETRIKVPSIDEQQKIGALFKLLDNIIALHQYKLDQLNILKKSCLQNMFI
ncbi:restriction endonuclease subunit S [Listeria booriae]|uniref:restriction endonuclease subunit S n=1 Tax=Listeria booriae TaxID=1552123 RepID=UPI00162A2206|nr:restriction endonuclease subunit S [Listeria booriae]MBC1945097.1 restriction endonuclease subunit S [Listeria booriae]